MEKEYKSIAGNHVVLIKQYDGRRKKYISPKKNELPTLPRPQSLLNVAQNLPIISSKISDDTDALTTATATATAETPTLKTPTTTEDGNKKLIQYGLLGGAAAAVSVFGYFIYSKGGVSE